MADQSKKWQDNVPGKYFVDDQCIDCDACRPEAPDSSIGSGWKGLYSCPKAANRGYN